MISKLNGLSDEEILEIRKVDISFDRKYQDLAQFVKETTINRGRSSEKATESLFLVGYTKANLIDIVIMIGDKMIINYVHNITHVPTEWPEVPAI